MVDFVGADLIFYLLEGSKAAIEPGSHSHRFGGPAGSLPGNPSPNAKITLRTMFPQSNSHLF